jgi:spore maturation protein CgeD
VSRLAVIFTAFNRPWAIRSISDALDEQTRHPDMLLVPCERAVDLMAVVAGVFSPALDAWAIHLPEPESVNALGYVINDALDYTDADYITYLTDDSRPHPDKYRLMAQALDENPDWGAVYCSQDYGSVESPEAWLAAAGRYDGSRRTAREPTSDPFTRVDHTQVMHRRCEARWPISYDDRKLSDAHFFKALVEEVGPIYPVPDVLDWTRQLPDGLSRR